MRAMYPNIINRNDIVLRISQISNNSYRISNTSNCNVNQNLILVSSLQGNIQLGMRHLRPNDSFIQTNNTNLGNIYIANENGRRISNNLNTNFGPSPGICSNGIAIDNRNNSTTLILNISPPADSILIPIRASSINIIRNPYNVFQVNSGTIILNGRLITGNNYKLVLELTNYQYEPTITYSSTYNGHTNFNKKLTVRKEFVC